MTMETENDVIQLMNIVKKLLPVKENCNHQINEVANIIKVSFLIKIKNQKT